jgi:hypothetical protein
LKKRDAAASVPIFPAGVTEINSQIAVQKETGRVCYLHGHLPVFQHEEQDVRSFHMLTSQIIDTGTVKPKEWSKRCACGNQVLTRIREILIPFTHPA